MHTAFFWTKLIPVLIHLNYSHYNSHRISLPPSTSNFTLASWNPFSAQSSSCSSLLSLFFPTPFDLTPPHVWDIQKYMVIQNRSNLIISSTQIIIPYGSNALPIKNWDFKGRFSFESNSITLSKLANTVNSNTITLSSIQCMLNSLLNRRCTFIFTPLLMHAISPTSLLIHPSTSVNVDLPISALPVHKIILTIPTNTSFLYTSAIFHFPIFAYNHPNSLHRKHFPYLSHLANSGCIKGPGSIGVLQPFSQFRLHQGTSELGTLVRTYTVLISPFFLVVWAVTTVLTIIDFLSLRLRKLLYYR